MDDKMVFMDLKGCKRILNDTLGELEYELDKCTFEYNFLGETQIVYNTFSTCLTSLVVRDIYTFNKYTEYLEGRIMYLKELLKEVQAQIERGPEVFDPDKLDNNIYRLWELSREE